MRELLTSSIGKKLVMSLSGLFLIVFLITHLSINALMLVPDGGVTYNKAAHFMGSNPLIQVMIPVLAGGMLIHIILGFVLTIQNRAARGNDRYASGNKTLKVSWASKNMLFLGITILAFLVIHIAHFSVRIKLTGHELLNPVTLDIGGIPTEVKNVYGLVNYTFQELWVVVVYVIAGIFLALHLSHGFWSSLQSIGMSNAKWRDRLNIAGNIYAWFVGIGFALIALLQYLFF